MGKLAQNIRKDVVQSRDTKRNYFLV